MLTTIETVMGEFGQTLRRLGREWGFVVAFVVTLALGIGANGAVFTALHAYLLQPLPYPHADRLTNVYVDSLSLTLPKGYISPTASNLLGKTPGVASWGLYQGGTATVISNDEPKSVGAVSVTASLFKTLGVHPFLGRWMDLASSRPGGPNEVVVSYRFWQSAFGGDPGAIGQSFKVDGKQYTVVGVMPRSFEFPDRDTMLWYSMMLTPKTLSRAYLMNYVNDHMIVRRSPDVSPAALHTALNAQLKRFKSPDPEYKRFLNKLSVGIIPLRQWFGGATGDRLLLMQLGALLLLVLAAANLGNLALVRMLRSRHELGLRVTLGASRLALLRLTLIETLPLGIAAAVVGWFLSRIGIQALAHFGIATSQTAFAIGAGGNVGLLGVLLSLVVAFIALAAPLVLVRSRHLTALLQSGGRGTAGGKNSRRTRKGLSVAQIALAVMLLSAATLVGLSLQRMLNRNPGFNPDGLIVATVGVTGPAYKSYEQVAGAWRATESAIADLPGVRAASVGLGVPFLSALHTVFRPVDNGSATSKPRRTSRVLAVSPKLLNTLGVRLLHGRLLNAADIQNDAHVVVVDARFAKAMFGTTDVVGRRVRVRHDWRIVGVIASIRDRFTQGDTGNSRGWVIVPASKTAYGMWMWPFMEIVLRSSLPTPVVERELKSAVAKALPGQAISRVATMNEWIGDSVRGTSALATLLIAFGLLAFALASVGTYGVVAYLTRLRRREFAIRLVLGARPWQIEWLVLAQGVALWAGGAVLGIGLAFLFGHFLRGQLYGVSLLSPAAYIVPALVLGVVVALASWLPARHVRRTALAETLNPQ